jgi:hypothetical protein
MRRKVFHQANKQIEIANRFALLTDLQVQWEMASIIGSNETRVSKTSENGNPVHNKHKHKIVLIGDGHAQGCAER